MCNGVHLHVHCEESAMDGLTKVKDLAKKAVSIGHTALALTDHGVCGAIPDFIKACEEEGIKPIPGCEVYTTKDRRVQSEALEEMRKNLCKKYMIVDKKGKPKMKVLSDFIKKFNKNYSCFEEEAHVILKDYFMSSDTLEQSLDLQSDEMYIFEVDLPNDGFGASIDAKIAEFKKDIYNYLNHGNFHMVLIALNNQGLEDLYEIVSDAHLNGFYSDPRTDLDFIRSRGLGRNLVATSACLGSYFSQLILSGRIEDAKEEIQACKDTFKHFYLEKQATLIPEQLLVNEWIDKLSIETNTPKILTNDVHYANKEDNHIHDILVASSTGKCLSDTDRYNYPHEYWMKTNEEMLEKCADPEAWANTAKIAEMVNVTLPKEPLFPKFPLTGEESVEEFLRKKAWEGLFEIHIREEIDIERYSKRLQYELDVICKEGFNDYFLITEDMIKATTKAGFLVGPGRGSGAGSLVCYALQITWLDPIKYGLLFERFLNPERAGYPDLDIDFSNAGALWVQHYLKGKYGNRNVAQIGTKGTLAARAVCRNVGKVLSIDPKVVDAFAKSIPDKPGIKLQKAYAEEDKVKEFAANYPEWWEAMLGLEGHLKSVGTHAGGIVISPEPLTKVTPLRKDSDGLETTQYDMKWIEKFLVKFDVLKIDALDIIKKTMEYAGIWGELNIYRDIDVNDPAIFERVYNALNLSGIFQCESDLFKKIIKDMKPNSFGDISVIVALGRPGPLDLIPTYVERKWGRQKVEYPFQELEPVLEETYGVWVYQEQIMQASQILGGLTLGQADMIRKGVSKKLDDLMNRWIDLMIYGSTEYKRMQANLVGLYPEPSQIPLNTDGTPEMWVDYEYMKQPDGIEGALMRGFELKTLHNIKQQWLKFGEYCFNKAHSAAYAKVSCITAWLKTYYPVQFMAALMTLSEGKKGKTGAPKNIHYMKECEEMGIMILPPDVNTSMEGWTPARYEMPIQKDDKWFFGEIRYGLTSIAKISGETVSEIMLHRPYASVQDMLDRVAGKKVNKTKVESLIKSGSFDFQTKNRNLLLREYYGGRGEEFEHIPGTTTKAHVLSYEIEMFGVSVSAKSRWSKIEDGANTQITGNILSIDEWTAKSSGKKHYKMSVETNEESIEVTVWGYLMERLGDVLKVGNRVTVKGEKSRDALTMTGASLVKSSEESSKEMQPA